MLLSLYVCNDEAWSTLFRVDVEARLLSRSASLPPTALQRKGHSMQSIIYLCCIHITIKVKNEKGSVDLGLDVLAGISALGEFFWKHK